MARSFQAVWCLVLLAICRTANSFDDNDLYGISAVIKTVYDLDKAVRFYTEVMDGMLIPEFRARNIRGDSHYYRMFQKEILEARDRGIRNPEDLGVPNIGSNGPYRMNWDFVLFDNAMMWLIQYTDSRGRTFQREDKNAGSAKTGYSHMALWMDNNVNTYQMMEAIVEAEERIRSDFPGFISTQDVSSFAERNQLFRQSSSTFATTENGGFRLAAFRGTDGEKLEFGIRRGIGAKQTLENFCAVGALHTVMMDCCYSKVAANQFKKERVRTLGFHHVSITVSDIDQGVEFYSQVIGGKAPLPISRKLQFPNDFKNMIMQDDILTARQTQRPLDTNYGYVELDFTNSSAGSLDVAFTNFINFYLELYTFNPGSSVNVQRFRDELERDWSSPAYRNVMAPAFWLKESVSMSSFIQRIERESRNRGWNNVRANRAVNINSFNQFVSDRDYSDPFSSGGLAGFDYTFMKGPAGEQFAVTQFNGRARQVLLESMKLYGSVSAAFTDTNPYYWGGFDSTCGPTPPPPPSSAPAPPPSGPGPAPGPGGRPTRRPTVGPNLKSGTTSPPRR